MTMDFEQQASLILAAEDCESADFNRLHKFGSNEERLISKLIAHGPVLLRGGRGCGKSALMIEASRRVAPVVTEAPAFGVYISLRHLQLLKSRDSAYERALCQIIIRSLQGNLVGEEFSSESNVESLQMALSKLSSKLDKRIILFFDDAAHIGREASLADFFEIFRTISSSTVSCKATIYPRVTRFGTRFDVFNDATLLDVSRAEEIPGFADLFADIMQARYPDALSDNVFSRSLSKKQVAAFLGQAVVGNMRAFVFACNELSLRLQGGTVTVGLPELGDILLHLATNHFWPLLEELKPKLGIYEPLISPAQNIAEIIFEKCGKNDARRSITIHRDILERIPKPFEILEYVGFIAKREASRSLKSGGRGACYVLNLCDLLEKSTCARLTKELFDRWSAPMPEPVEFHLKGTELQSVLMPELKQDAEIAILGKPIEKLRKSNAYPYGLTEAKIGTLLAAEIKTVGDLASASDERLDALPTVGPANVRRFRNVVGQAIWM